MGSTKIDAFLRRLLPLLPGSLIAVFAIQCAKVPKRPNLNPRHDQGAEIGDTFDVEAEGNTENVEGKVGEKIPVNVEGPNTVFEAIMSEIDKDTCTNEVSSSPSTRIITDEEWIDSVNAIFDVNLDRTSMIAELPRSTISSDGAFKEFNHLREDNTMSIEKIESFDKASGLAASEIVKAKGDKIMNCGGQSKDCVKTWLLNTLPRLWKKSMGPADVLPLVELFEKAGSNKVALERLIKRVTLSHQFLFRSSLGLEGNLNSWEMASNLSDVLWASPLTPELAKIAQADGLKTKAEIEKQAATMIADPRFYNGLKRFVRSWLRTDHIKNLTFTEAQKISASAKEDLVDESTNYLYHLIRTKADTFENIFKSKFTVGTENLATTYGFTKGAAATTTPKASNLSILSFPEGRFGLLSQPGFIASVSSLTESKPPKRGREVMAIFMCQSRVTPPNLQDLVTKVGGKFTKDASVVENFKSVTTGNPVCEGCHITLNGIGFGMEDISSVGFIRTTDDNMKPVVADGNLVSITGKKIPYKGIAGLNEALSQSKDAQGCLTLQMFRMVNARKETRHDACLIANAFKRASEKEFRLSEVFTALLTDDGYLSRKKAGK